jgi:hypothetical protein
MVLSALVILEVCGEPGLIENRRRSHWGKFEGKCGRPIYRPNVRVILYVQV